MPRAIRSVLAEAAVLLLFASIAIVLTWPFAVHLATAVPDPSDAYVSTYVMRWDAHASASREPLFSPPIFYPARLALAFSEHLYGIALPFFPLYASAIPPLAIYNLILLFSYAFTGYGAFVLCRAAAVRPAAAFAGGCFFAFMPYRMNQISHVSYVAAGWLALMLAAWIWWLRGPSRGRALLFGAAFLMNGLACLHWMVFGAGAVLLSLPLAVALFPGARSIRRWIPLATATAAATLLLLPFLLPYREVRALYGMQREVVDTAPFSATLRDWLVSPLQLRYGPLVNNGSTNPEIWLFTGLVPLLLALFWMRNRIPASRLRAESTFARRATAFVADAAAAALLVVTYLRTAAVLPLHFDLSWAAIDIAGSPITSGALAVALFAAAFLLRGGRPRQAIRPELWIALFWIACGFALSFGTRNRLYAAAFETLSPLRGIRVHARWAMIAYAGLAIVAAAAVSELIERRRRRAAAIAIAALCAGAIVAEVQAPMRFFFTVPGEAPVYRWIASHPARGAMLELPYRAGKSEYAYMLHAAAHLQPMLNGASSFEPRDRDELQRVIDGIGVREPHGDGAEIAYLSRLGCTRLVVHTERLGDRRDAVQSWLVREVAARRAVLVARFCGDHVFELDAAGDAPAAPFPGFSSECDRPVGIVDEPKSDADVRGPLVVRVRASAPEGIARVEAIFAGGTRVPLTREAGGTFSARIPDRPHAVDRDTDVQISILTAHNRRALLEDQFLGWRRRTDIRFYDWKDGAPWAIASRMGRPPEFGRRIIGTTMPIGLLARELTRQTRDADDAGFLATVTRALLNRSPAAGDAHLLRGRSRAEAVIAIAESDEFAQLNLRPSQ